jgi:hypothetical protein
MSPLDTMGPLDSGHSPMFLQVRVAEDRRFELLRGVAPNTLSNNAGQRSPASATVRELHKHHPSEHW